MRYVPAIIIAIALILAPIVFLGVSMVLQAEAAPGGGDSPSESRLRTEVAELRAQLDRQAARIRALEAIVSSLQSQVSARAIEAAPSASTPLERTGENKIARAYTQVVLIANRTGFNEGLTVAGASYLEATLGRPRAVMNDIDCLPLDNPNLSAKLERRRVGPIKEVRMLEPALDSLERVFERIKDVDLDLYNQIQTSGALCVRLARKGRSISSHAFGTAIDLNIAGELDNFTDGKTQLGLTILADFFKAEGWIWGAGFSREDSMHFEVSRELLDEWLRDGLI